MFNIWKSPVIYFLYWFIILQCLWYAFLIPLIYFNWRIIAFNIVIFFPYIDMNQPQVYMCPPMLHPPATSLLAPSLWVVPEHQLWVPCFMHGTCTGHLYFVWSCTCLSADLSDHPHLAVSRRVPKSVLYVCVSFAALHVGPLCMVRFPHGCFHSTSNCNIFHL